MKLFPLLTAATLAQAVWLSPLKHAENGKLDRVVKTSSGFINTDEAGKLEMKRQGEKFIDYTDIYRQSLEEAMASGDVAATGGMLHFMTKNFDTLKKPIPKYNYPKEAAHSDIVEPLLDQIDIESVRQNLANFTSFYTRYYKSETGLESANWLHAKISEIVAVLPSELVEIRKIHHSDWDQYSIVVSIKGKVAEKVVVGAHQDSINLLFPNLLRAPGADDDGSGTVTTLEALRLVSSAVASGQFKPHNTLEFHYYSAEEGGLLGSMDVFSRYYKENATVVGMLQQDMTGYTAGTRDSGVEPHFGLISDYTSVRLNDFIKVIVQAYCGIPVHETQCGYACSDHASALENGYPASFLIESEFKYTAKQIHSVMDTIDRLDFDHIHEHIKLTVGYAVELASADVN